MLARIIEPTSKLDSLRVLEEAGATVPSYRTVKRRLRTYAGADLVDEHTGEVPSLDPAGGPWRARLSRACAGHVHLGPTTLLLYDVTTLYFETDTATGSANPGSPRNGAWNHRSRSGCSPTAPGSR